MYKTIATQTVMELECTMITMDSCDPHILSVQYMLYNTNCLYVFVLLANITHIANKYYYTLRERERERESRERDEGERPRQRETERERGEREYASGLWKV